MAEKVNYHNGFDFTDKLGELKIKEINFETDNFRKDINLMKFIVYSDKLNKELNMINRYLSLINGDGVKILDFDAYVNNFHEVYVSAKSNFEELKKLQIPELDDYIVKVGNFLEDVNNILIKLKTLDGN